MIASVGSELKRQREALGLSRSFVARQAEIDPAVLFRIENGRSVAPTFEVICRLAKSLGIGIETLLPHDRKRSPSSRREAAINAKVEADKIRLLLTQASERLETLAGALDDI